MSRIISPNHHLWTATSDVNAICDPLFRETEVTYFNYARAYHDGTIAALFTHPQWLLHSLQYKVAPSFVEFRGFSSITLFGSNIESPSVVDSQRNVKSVVAFKELLGFDYLICLNYQFPDFYEAFAFATYINNTKMIEFYLNHLDYFKKFVAYFREKANFLIKNAIVPENKIIRSTIEPLQLQKEKTKKNFLIAGTNNKPLTAREIECLTYISKGRSAKEIGNILGVSTRTIEAHIYNIKSKLGCHRRSQLVDIALNHRLELVKP